MLLTDSHNGIAVTVDVTAGATNTILEVVRSSEAKVRTRYEVIAQRVHTCQSIHPQSEQSQSRQQWSLRREPPQ